MPIRKWWLALALVSAGMASCANSHHVSPEADGEPDASVGVQEPEQPVEGDAAVVAEHDGAVHVDASARNDASIPGDARVATSLVTVESALGGTSTESKSGRYTMYSRVAAPMGSAVNASTDHYQLQTGILALQDGEP